MKTGMYAVLPAFVRYDKEISAQAKLLYAEISAATNAHGVAEDDNAYFGACLHVDRKTVSRCLAQLIEHGHIISLSEKGRRKLKVVLKQIPLPEDTELKVVKSVDAEGLSKDIDNIISTWEERRKCNIQDREHLHPLIKARLKTFTAHEIMEALDKRLQYLHKSAWHNSPVNADVSNDLRPIMASDEDLLRWLNALNN